MTEQDPLDESIIKSLGRGLDKFFKMHEGDSPSSGLYDRIISEVERLLIEKTLEHAKNIQINAARILGVNRNTLRKKIKKYKISSNVKY